MTPHRSLSSKEPASSESGPRIPKWRDALAGAIAGAISKTAMAPVERVKLLLQLQDSAKGIAGNSAWEVARDVYYDEGILAFWRGNVPNVMRHAGQAGLNFALMDYYKNVAFSPLVSRFTHNKKSHVITKEGADRRRNLVVSFVSGGMAGGTATTVLYPIEYMRTRLAMDQGRSVDSRQYRGMADVVVKTVRADGIRGLYQGFGVALWGSVVYRLLHLGGYDVVKREAQLSKKMNNNPETTTTFAERFLLAQLVSLSAGTICYPIDSVRRRLMMQAGKPATERLYRNSLHCFHQVWVREGVRGFYLGLGPNLVRSIGGALMLVSYDALKELL